MVVVAVALWTLYQQHWGEDRSQQHDNNEEPSSKASDLQKLPLAKEPASSSLRARPGNHTMHSTPRHPATWSETKAKESFSGDPQVYESNDESDNDEHDLGDEEESLPDVFLDSVKQDWLTAMFGPRFWQTDGPAAAENTGHEAGIAGPFVTHTATIPPVTTTDAATSHDTDYDTRHTDNRIGMTICKYPLGVYVKHVQIGSEAYLAGVRRGYILVSLNGMNFLGEPSGRALERLWQYEGHLTSAEIPANTDAKDSSEGVAKPMHAKTSSSRPLSGQQSLSTPISMTFFYQGALQRKKVLLLSQPPFGITWAPCVNVPLIKRVHGERAKNAGIQPGSLLMRVSSVSGSSDKPSAVTFQNSHHVALAQALTQAARSTYSKYATIQVTCCFAPKSSRTNEFERSQLTHDPIMPTERDQAKQNLSLLRGFGHKRTGNRKNRDRLLATKSYDGVLVKFHSFDLGLCAPLLLETFHRERCPPDAPRKHPRQEFAALVAAGLMEGPSGTQRQVMSQTQLDQISAKRRYVQRLNLSHPLEYSPCPSLVGDELLRAWDPLESLLYCLQLSLARFDEERLCSLLEQSRQEDSAIRLLSKITSRSSACCLVSAFLLQFVGIMCAPTLNAANTEGDIDDECFVFTDAGIVKSAAKDLTSMLLRLAENDQEFCQKLYFLLRSYISTLETPRPCQEGPRSLMSLLNCLELLRFAENELAQREMAPAQLQPSIVHAQSTPHPSAHRDQLTVTPLQRRSESAPALDPLTVDHGGSMHSVAIVPDSSSEFQMKKPRFARFRKRKGEKTRPAPVTSTSSPTTMYNTSDAQVLSPSHELRQIHQTATLTQQTSPRISHNSLLQERVLVQSPSVNYENMSDFLSELDRICQTIERSLQKSFRQKMADWALQPWSPSKDTALAQVTELMRSSLNQLNGCNTNTLLLVNPVDSSELLSSVDHNECYILPSAHFPILFTFNVSERRSSDHLTGEERLYRTKVELVALKGRHMQADHAFTVHGAVAGKVIESGASKKLTADGQQQTWKRDKILIFDSRSSWGAPQALSLRLSSRLRKDDGSFSEVEELGFGWLDLSEQFKATPDDEASTSVCYADIWPVGPGVCLFDEHGQFHVDGMSRLDRFTLEMKITTESIGLGNDSLRAGVARKRMLLYKHVEDIRQEAFATQFVALCSNMLKAAGLDLKLLSFQCVPVGSKRGFVEWVPGSVPLSEICQPLAGSTVQTNDRPYVADINCPSMFSKAGLTKYESLRRLGGQQNGRLCQLSSQKIVGQRGSFLNNPIQDYLRSVAFDARAPYMIRKDVMDTYIKSVAGYSLITYILGVGDRHLDNLLLHQSGALFHCDYSYILGRDPKTYQPVRVTEDMIDGMGGPASDNYARFLSTVGASFLVLRRPENARALLSLVRMMEYSSIPDISENQTTAQAIFGLRERLQLHLADQEAVAFIEDLLESSQRSSLWKAVDVIHNLGKKF